jgi:hypothetical protein
MLGGGGMLEQSSAVFGGGGTAEEEPSAVTGGGEMIEQDGRAVTGGGGIAEQPAKAVTGGGGIAEQPGSAVTGGGGMIEQDGSAVTGGGGIAEQVGSAVTGGGGILEHDSTVDGGGGITDPPSTPPGDTIAAERSELSAPGREYFRTSVNASPSASPESSASHASDSIPSWCARYPDSVTPRFRVTRLRQRMLRRTAGHSRLTGPPTGTGRRAGLRMAVTACTSYGARCNNHDVPRSARAGAPGPGPGRSQHALQRRVLPQVPSGSSEVHITTRVRSPRNRSRANSSGSPERA